MPKEYDGSWECQHCGGWHPWHHKQCTLRQCTIQWYNRNHGANASPSSDEHRGRGKGKGGARRSNGASPVLSSRAPHDPASERAAPVLDLPSAQSLLEQFGNNETEAGPALKGLIEAAKSVVAASKASSPPASATAGELASAEAKLAHAMSKLAGLEGKVAKAKTVLCNAETAYAEGLQTIEDANAKVAEVRSRMLEPVHPSFARIDHIAALFDQYLASAASVEDVRRALQLARVAERSSPEADATPGNLPTRHRISSFHSEATRPERDHSMQGDRGRGRSRASSEVSGDNRPRRRSGRGTDNRREDRSRS